MSKVDSTSWRLAVLTRIQTVSLAAAVAAWFGIVLRYQYRVESLDAYVLDFDGVFLQFIARTQSEGVPSAGVMFPALYGLEAHGAHYPFGYLHERVRKHYEDAQTPYLDLLPAFLTFRDPHGLWVNHFDAHPNAKANRLAAVAIHNAFLPIWRRNRIERRRRSLD